MSLINNSFMINNAPGQRLYSEIAKALPIIDYHCHLDARAIWENKPFTDITQLWLEGDHYKWRAMRANGISEQRITGNASAEEKFEARAQTVEASFGNPLYHWTHLELKHYFAIDETLNSKTGAILWRSVIRNYATMTFTAGAYPPFKRGSAVHDRRAARRSGIPSALAAKATFPTRFAHISS